MNIADGTYAAKPGLARVYENDKGSLVLCIEMQIEGGPVLKSFHTLAKADGTLMTRTIDNLKAWSGWDGTDPFWFVDNDLTGCAVEVVIENQPGMNDPSRLFPSVKWVNPPGGGGGGMAESGDRRTILAKYGGKLRANSGGVPTAARAPQRPANSQPAAVNNETAATGRGYRDAAEAVPASVPSPVPARPAPPPIAPKISDMNTCWGLMCDLRKKMPKAQVEQEWFASVGIIEGKDQADMTPEDWGRVEEFILAKYGSGGVPRPALAGTAGDVGRDNLPF